MAHFLAFETLTMQGHCYDHYVLRCNAVIFQHYLGMKGSLFLMILLKSYHLVFMFASFVS